MTRDKAKELLPIIKAFGEGKTIQYKNSMMSGWAMTVPGSNFLDFTILSNGNFEVRIKPESKYIPFTFEDRELFRNKWVRSKSSKSEFMITEITNNSEISTKRRYNSVSLENAFKLYEFIDGTPFGKLVEE